MTKEEKRGMAEEWQTGNLPENVQEWSEGCTAKSVQVHEKECNQILKKERMGRGISQIKLSQGLLSRAALQSLEDGRIGWSKTMGDILMHRMGISAEYFETVAFGEELERWRDREDICRLVPEKPQEARDSIEEYRQKYQNRESFEEQFLLKAEAILMIECRRRASEGALPGVEEVLQAEKVLQTEEVLGMPEDKGLFGAPECGALQKMAERAAACTIPDGWEYGLEKFWLAPPELGAVLLAGYVKFLQGKVDAAWKLQQEVWKYPERRQWKERMEVLIKPQAALLGIVLALRRKDADAALAMGREALELLRRNRSQRYLLPLLDALGKIPAGKGSTAEYLKQAAEYARTFRQIYEVYGCPGYRMWQSIDMRRTREAGLSLKMLRMFYGRTRAEAVFDASGQIVTGRHLAKIEQGNHKPSLKNYQRLAKQYGKNGGWGVPILETDLVEVLELQQHISELLEFGRWEEAEWEIRRFRRLVDVGYPRVRQELLFWEALLKKNKEHALEESLEMLFEALDCTIPDVRRRNMAYWVFQQEEIVIAGNVAMLYHKLGRQDKARVWLEAVIHSVKMQEDRTGIKCIGYDMIVCAYHSLLADMGLTEKASQEGEEAVRAMLESARIRCLPAMLYQEAWNSYKAASGGSEKQKSYQTEWREAYCVSEALDDFIYDDRHKALMCDDSGREEFSR